MRSGGAGATRERVARAKLRPVVMIRGREYWRKTSRTRAAMRSCRKKGTALNMVSHRRRRGERARFDLASFWRERWRCSRHPRAGDLMGREGRVSPRSGDEARGEAARRDEIWQGGRTSGSPYATTQERRNAQARDGRRGWGDGGRKVEIGSKTAHQGRSGWSKEIRREAQKRPRQGVADRSLRWALAQNVAAQPDDREAMIGRWTGRHEDEPILVSGIAPTKARVVRPRRHARRGAAISNESAARRLGPPPDLTSLDISHVFRRARSAKEESWPRRRAGAEEPARGRPRLIVLPRCASWRSTGRSGPESRGRKWRPWWRR